MKKEDIEIGKTYHHRTRGAFTVTGLCSNSLITGTYENDDGCNAFIGNLEYEIIRKKFDGKLYELVPHENEGDGACDKCALNGRCSSFSTACWSSGMSYCNWKEITDPAVKENQELCNLRLEVKELKKRMTDLEEAETNLQEPYAVLVEQPLISAGELLKKASLMHLEASQMYKYKIRELADSAVKD